jgi:hypothetical protein
VCRGTRKYQLFTDDIQEVHRANPRKKPPLPSFDCPSTNDSNLDIRTISTIS